MGDNKKIQRTSYKGSDSSVSITQHQDADDQAQLTLTGEKLLGDWTSRAIVERRYDDPKVGGHKTHFIPHSTRRSIRGMKQKYGETFLLGYALVRPNTNISTTRSKDEMWAQFEEKDEAYIWEKQQPMYLAEERVTPRFIYEVYHVDHRWPKKSGWSGIYRVDEAKGTVGEAAKFRIVGVAEVPPGTVFKYPFRSLTKLKERLDDDAKEYELNPHFRRVA